jgi:TonB family protein
MVTLGRNLRDSLRTEAGFRLFVVPVVAVLHLAALWVFVSSLATQSTVVPDKELTVVLDRAPAAAAPGPPLPAVPDPVIVPPPQFVIEDDPGNNAAKAAPGAMVLAPRPDPSRPNDMPEGVGQSASSSTAEVVLKILILPDGTVGDASVIHSCGNPDTDADLAAYLRAHWHFLPALLGGNPVRYWTTVSVAIGRPL